MTPDLCIAKMIYVCVMNETLLLFKNISALLDLTRVTVLQIYWQTSSKHHTETSSASATVGRKQFKTKPRTGPAIPQSNATTL